MSGSNFRTLPFPKSEDVLQDIKRYTGCKVRWRRGSTVVDGILEFVSRNDVKIKGLNPIRFSTDTDCLFWDADGPEPEPEWDSEVKELAELLYKSWMAAGSIPWHQLPKDVKERWYKTAAAGIEWADNPPKKCTCCSHCSACSPGRSCR